MCNEIKWQYTVVLININGNHFFLWCFFHGFSGLLLLKLSALKFHISSEQGSPSNF